MNKLSAVVETINPELAWKYLAMNTENPRKINRNIVCAYAEDMKAGRWVLNGEPICFDENGVLTNGQHRLHAIIKAGTSISALVVRNIEPGCKVYDYGLKRTVTTTLNVDSSIGGAANAITTNCGRY